MHADSSKVIIRYINCLLTVAVADVVIMNVIIVAVVVVVVSSIAGYDMSRRRERSGTSKPAKVRFISI